MGKKILLDIQSEKPKEDLEAIEIENALIKKKNNRVFFVLFFTPVFVSILGYFYLSLFWEQDRLIFDVLPQFMQEFGILKKNTDILISQNRLNIANNYAINYWFGLFYIVIVLILSTRYDFLTPEPNKKRMTSGRGGVMVAISLVILFFVYSVFFSESIFVGSSKLSSVLRIELFGIAFYSMLIAITSIFLVLLIQGTRLIRKEAANASRNNRRL